MPPSPSVPSNFVQLLRPDCDRVDPDYLFWILWSWHQRGLPAKYQTATTNIRNLQTKEYLGLRIDLPDRVVQKTIAAVADALQETGRAADQFAKASLQLRLSLLADFLSGSAVIPESYDRFLDGAA